MCGLVVTDPEHMTSNSEDGRSAHIEAANKFVDAVERYRQIWAAVTDDSISVEQFQQLADSLVFEMIEAKRALLEARASKDGHDSRDADSGRLIL